MLCLQSTDVLDLCSLQRLQLSLLLLDDLAHRLLLAHNLVPLSLNELFLLSDRLSGSLNDLLLLLDLSDSVLRLLQIVDSAHQAVLLFAQHLVGLDQVCMVPQDVLPVLVLLTLSLSLRLHLLQLKPLAHQRLVSERTLLNLLVQLQSQVVCILLSFDEPFFEHKDLLSHALLGRRLLLPLIVCLDQLQQ